ncbi:hypothetical protein VNI00_017276 [Paramarasmius palmivorus]|uniref:Uncharacterized protein n=1 Tax=Paramarasmius palmivorus TaxID=297713 RepID=A0AAW0B6N4_9AGAR
MPLPTLDDVLQFATRMDVSDPWEGDPPAWLQKKPSKNLQAVARLLWWIDPNLLQQASSCPWNKYHSLQIHMTPDSQFGNVKIYSWDKCSCWRMKYNLEKQSRSLLLSGYLRWKSRLSGEDPVGGKKRRKISANQTSANQTSTDSDQTQESTQPVLDLSRFAYNGDMDEPRALAPKAPVVLYHDLTVTKQKSLGNDPPLRAPESSLRTGASKDKSQDCRNTPILYRDLTVRKRLPKPSAGPTTASSHRLQGFHPKQDVPGGSEECEVEVVAVKKRVRKRKERSPSVEVLPAPAPTKGQAKGKNAK